MINALAFVGCIAAAAKTNNDDKAAASLQRIDEIGQTLVSELGVTGLAVTAVAVQKETETTAAWAKGYGYANVETETPITPDTTVFQVASITQDCLCHCSYESHRRWILDIFWIRWWQTF